jgi:tetratricopeptide (TPR) repeat protein
MYENAAWTNSPDRDMFTAKAREAYERMIELDPLGAWKNVNFAIFLNEYVADYDGAERYAERALEIMEFPMARYQLAAARYQKLWASPPTVGAEALQSAIAEVASSTEVSLEDAIAFRSFSTRMRIRLEQLQSRSQEATE